MFNNAMGLILADNKKISLGELSNPRALSAMPFGGRYRIIDFMLSNMVNSGVKNVGLLTYNKYKSLMDHLGTGGAWSLDRKNDGLHILPAPGALLRHNRPCLRTFDDIPDALLLRSEFPFRRRRLRFRRVLVFIPIRLPLPGLSVPGIVAFLPEGHGHSSFSSSTIL